MSKRNFIMDTISYKWCTSSDSYLLDTLADLFVENAGAQYISHGEVIDGRANNMNEWKTNIKTIIKEEFAEAMHIVPDSFKTFSRITIAQQNGYTVALALVEFRPETKVAILCDIVVSAQLRSQKIGESMLCWIEAEAKQWGANFIFLESGNTNQSAHHFFKRMGFHATSVVMMKEIYR